MSKILFSLLVLISQMSLAMTYRECLEQASDEQAFLCEMAKQNEELANKVLQMETSIGLIKSNTTGTSVLSCTMSFCSFPDPSNEKLKVFVNKTACGPQPIMPGVPQASWQQIKVTVDNGANAWSTFVTLAESNQILKSIGNRDKIKDSVNDDFSCLPL